MLVGSLIPKVAPDQVSANTTDVEYTGVSGTVYAGIQFNTDGSEWANAGPNSASFTLSRGTWLNSGSSASVWVERSISGASLNWQDPGAGRQQLNTTREFGLSRTTDGESNSVVTFDFYDASTAGNLLDSVTVTLSVVRGAL